MKQKKNKTGMKGDVSMSKFASTPSQRIICIDGDKAQKFFEIAGSTRMTDAQVSRIRKIAKDTTSVSMSRKGKK